MREPAKHAEVADRLWGTGRKIGRTLYARERNDGVPAAGDVYFGTVDDLETARYICELHNRHFWRKQQGVVE